MAAKYLHSASVQFLVQSATGNSLSGWSRWYSVTLVVLMHSAKASTEAEPFPMKRASSCPIALRLQPRCELCRGLAGSLSHWNKAIHSLVFPACQVCHRPGDFLVPPSFVKQLTINYMRTGCCRDEWAINNKSCKQGPLHLAAFISIGEMHHGAKFLRNLVFVLSMCLLYMLLSLSSYPKHYEFSLHYTKDYTLLIDVQKQ